MPRPKLSEEEKRETVPLRLLRDEIRALDAIALIWGESRGKEAKRATVARELVLIGLGVVDAVRGSKLIKEIVKDDDSEALSEIREMILGLRKDGISVESAAMAVLHQLKSARARTARDADIQEECIEIEPIDPLSVINLIQRSAKKGGHK